MTPYRIDLLDSIYIRFDIKLYRKIVGFPGEYFPISANSRRAGCQLLAKERFNTGTLREVAQEHCD